MYGAELVINLTTCKYQINQSMLRNFVILLCKKLKMKRHGECHIEMFGRGKRRGLSMFQFITTSSICGHFTQTDGYLNIFSCKKFNESVVATLVTSWFAPEHMTMQLIRR